jgi:glutathione synthase
MPAKIPFLWITDPWETLAPYPLETTLRWAEEAERLGYESHFCDVHSLRLENRRLIFEARRLESVAPGREAFKLGKPITTSLERYRQIHYRVDPPIDLAYLHPLQMLALHASASGAEIVNPASTLFSLNEKFAITPFKGLSPETLISSDQASLIAFGTRLGKAVAKPLHQAGSRGVELVDFTANSRGNLNLALVSLTENFKKPILLQKFLPQISAGEQRLWFVDGKLLAFARKLPLKNDFRVAIDQGSGVEASKLSAKEKKAVPQLQKILKKNKIRLAAIDLIDGLVTDFNFTSPGLIVQMENVLKTNLSKTIIKSLLARGK